MKAASLVQLLAWRQRAGEQINWRQAICRDEVVSSITISRPRSIEQDGVTLILHQQPAEVPPFLRPAERA